MKKLKELLELGAITQEEFDEKISITKRHLEK
ncbi:MAG: SHOCT domain-containing protein [Bacteroidetes bacterium]|nr:SHOCT domain-containing protein [Bacteroidota bacterium]